MNGADSQLNTQLNSSLRRHRNAPVVDAVVHSKQLQTMQSSALLK